MKIYFYLVLFNILKKFILNQNQCYYDETLLNSICTKCSSLMEGCLTCSTYPNSTFICKECSSYFKPLYDITNSNIQTCVSSCSTFNIDFRDIYKSDMKNTCQFSQWGYQQSFISVIDSNNPVPRATSKQELLSLISIFESLNGNFWTNNNNWLVDDPCTNSWFGVQCNKYGNIIGLYFKDNFLNGIIPDTINGLVNLRYIYFINSPSLDDAGIIWKVSEKLFTLPLKEIVLYNVGINQEINSNLFVNPFLQIIDLSFNKLRGSFTTGKLINNNLVILNLSDNKISGSLSFLDNFTKLEVIELQNNLFTGDIPVLSKLYDGLRIFDIRNNNLNGPFPMSYLNQKDYKKIEYSAMHLNANLPVPEYCVNNALCLTRIYSNPMSGDDRNFQMTPEIQRYLEKLDK